MKKSISIGILILFLTIAIQSNAEMRITEGGVTFPDSSVQTKAVSGGGVSAPLNLSSSLTTGDYTHNPDGAIISGVNADSGLYYSYGGYFTASGLLGRGVYGHADNAGNNENYGGYFDAEGLAGRGVYGHASGSSGIGVHGHSSGWSGTGVRGTAGGTGPVTNRGGYFSANGTSGIGVEGKAQGTSGTGVRGYGGLYNFYAAGPGTDYAAFTGAHEVKFAKNMPGEIVPGMIVSVTGKTETRKDKNGGISLSSTLPTVTISTKAKDKAVFGVIVSDAPLPKEHWYETQEGERFGVVNALGEGRVWVTDFNGQVQAGDYITTSFVPGYGQIQDDDILHSYTLGKAIETVDWEQATETVENNGKTYKRYLIVIVYTSG